MHGQFLRGSSEFDHMEKYTSPAQILQVSKVLLMQGLAACPCANTDLFDPGIGLQGSQQSRLCSGVNATMA